MNSHNIELCSGYGQFHSPNNKKNPIDYTSTTLKKIIQQAANPSSTVKESAQWVIFSQLKSRVHQEQRKRGVFHALWADIDTNPPSLTVLERDVEDISGGNHILYTSRSATEAKQKSRIIIPISEPCPGNQFVILQKILNNILEQAGITPDRANERTGQVCYLPNRGEYYDFQITDQNGGFNWRNSWAAEIKAENERLKRMAEKLKTKREQACLKAAERIAAGTHNPLQAYKDAYDIATCLESYGYTRCHGDLWLSPNSESGKPGVKVKNGKWFSHHSSDASIGKINENGLSWGDAFDLFLHYEHGGNRNAAIQAAGVMFTVEGGVSITKANQRAYMERTAQLNLNQTGGGGTKTPSAPSSSTMESILKWIDETESTGAIISGWIQKAMGLEGSEVDIIRRAIRKKTGVGLKPLKDDYTKHQKKLQKERNSENAAKEGRDQIEFDPTKTFYSVIKISKVLQKHPNVYRYGNLLASVFNERPATVRMVQKVHKAGGVYPKMPLIFRHSVETLSHELEQVADCLQENKEGEIKSIPWPANLLKGFMASPYTREKPLVGVVEHPYINESFIPEMTPGYDPQTGLVKSFDASLKLQFGETVTEDEARNAFKYLCNEVFDGFPFASELDRVAAVSVLLAAMQRKMIYDDSGCPGYLFDAPVQSTGKTTLAQTISYSIHNRPAAATSYTESNEEMAKHLLAILMEGHSCVLFDNLSAGTVIESDELAKCMTSATYSKRLLGINKTVTVPSSVLWLFTGNNISVVGDFNTRVLSIRLDTGMSDPDRRSFKRKNVGEWCSHNREEILWSVMAIILHSKGKACPLSGTRYPDWDRFVRIPLYMVTKVDIADLFERNKQNDPKIEGQRGFLESWFECFGSTPTTSKTALDEVRRRQGISQNEDFEDAIRDIFNGNLPGTKGLSNWMSGLKGRIIGGYRLGSVMGTARHNFNKKCWIVNKI